MGDPSAYDIPSEMGGLSSDWTGQDTTAPTDASGASLFSGATDDAPPPADANFPGSDLISMGAAAGLNWARNPGGDLQPASRVTMGPNGNVFSYDSNGPPNLGVFPMNPGLYGGVRITGGRGGGSPIGRILQLASMGAGFDITRKALVYLIRTLGVPAVLALTKLLPEMLLYFWMKKPRRGARGPHLRTVLKRVRQGEKYRTMLAHYARKAHAGGRSSAPRYAFQRRRRRSRSRR